VRVATRPDCLVQNIVSDAAHIASPNGMQWRTDAEKFAGSVELGAIVASRLFVQFTAH
jgi:hypothetical protein